jgi:hypothetical protein
MMDTMDAVMDVSKDKGIPRRPITDAEVEVASVKNEVLRQASMHLGYHANEVDPAGRHRAVLARTLKDAGIEPLDKRAVARYQASERRFANRFWWKIGAVMVTLAAFENVMYASRGTASVGDQEAVYVIGGAFVLGVAMAAAFIRKSWFQWVTKSLIGYDRPVPEFALAYALAIKRENPDVEFHVEELVREDHVADPFLVVYFGQAAAYIAVWDEPKFEGRG